MVYEYYVQRSHKFNNSLIISIRHFIYLDNCFEYEEHTGNVSLIITYPCKKKNRDYYVIENSILINDSVLIMVF